MKINLKELASMDDKQREKLFKELIRVAMLPPTAEELAELDAKIKAYESKYNLSSDKIHSSIDDGSLKETDEVCSWLMLVGLRNRLKNV